MYYVYVLRSIPTGNLYKGFCRDLNKRINEHNSGKTVSTKPFRPWEIIYFEIVDSLEEAIAKEKYFKTSAGRRYLRNIL